MRFPNRLTPLETFYEYLCDVLVASKVLKEKHVKMIFLKALDDYFKGNISLEYLEVAASQLYYGVNKPHEVDIYYERDLARALFDATEISYYYSHQRKNSAKKTYEAQIKNLKEYYEKNKHLLKDFPSEA